MVEVIFGNQKSGTVWDPRLKVGGGELPPQSLAIIQESLGIKIIYRWWLPESMVVAVLTADPASVRRHNHKPVMIFSSCKNFRWTQSSAAFKARKPATVHQSLTGLDKMIDNVYKLKRQLEERL